MMCQSNAKKYPHPFPHQLPVCVTVSCRDFPQLPSTPHISPLLCGAHPPPPPTRVLSIWNHTDTKKKECGEYFFKMNNTTTPSHPASHTHTHTQTCVPASSPVTLPFSSPPSSPANQHPPELVKRQICSKKEASTSSSSFSFYAHPLLLCLCRIFFLPQLQTKKKNPKKNNEIYI